MADTRSRDELLAENQLLKETVQALGGEVVFRANPRLGEMSDALNSMIRNSKTGNAAAKEMLRKFYEAFDEGRAASTGIDVVKSNLKVLRRT